MRNGYLEQYPSIIKLFFSFLRLGLTAFGGPAMIALIRKMDLLLVVTIGGIISVWVFF